MNKERDILYEQVRDIRDRMLTVRSHYSKKAKREQEAYDRICARERRWHYSLELAERLIEGR